MTAWLFAIGIVVLIGGVAVVAAGRGAPLAEVYDDRPDARVPAGPLGPADLRGVRFSTAFRGYRADEVDALLDRLAEQLAEEQERAVREEPARTDPPDVP
jgi:DivIVA domain-containing protein